MESNEILDQYKDTFFKYLENFCNTYKAVGVATVESPMWLQFDLFNCCGNDGTYLKFKSSQCALGFRIDLISEDHTSEIDDLEFSDTYEYFRSLKYTYIEENHPTIYKELR